MAVHWTDPRKAAKAAEEKYKALDNLLLQYGLDNITKESFWGHMNQNGWGQDDIDAYLTEYYIREKEKDDAREKAEREKRNGTTRATASRDARGASGEGRLVGPRGTNGARKEADRQGDQAEEAGPCQAAKDNRPGQVIELDDHWKQKAKRVGQERYDIARKRGYINKGAWTEATPEMSINGCIAECGVGKRYRLPWNPNVGVIDGIDVGKIIEVRGRPPGKEMGVRMEDKRYLPIVFAWVYPDHSVKLLGWLYGFECMHEPGDDTDQELWNVNSQCWYVPPPYRPLEELDEILADDVEVERILQRHLRWVREEMPAAKKAAEARKKKEKGS